MSDAVDRNSGMISNVYIASFSYSFFDGADGLEVLPQAPIDPIPQTLRPPTFRPDTNTLELTLSDFFSLDSLSRSEPYQVYLGPLGPLQTSLYRSVAPPKAGSDDGISPHFEAVPYSDTGLASGETYRTVRSDWPCTIPHVIVVIDMPRAEEIIRTMQECFAEAQYKATSTLQALPNDSTEADGWLIHHDQVGGNDPQTSHAANETSRDQQADPSSAAAAPNIAAEVQKNEQPYQQRQPEESSFMPETLGQGDIGLDQIFDPPHDQSRDRHDVDDISAALASAQDAEFALSQIDDAFLTSTLGPTLQDEQTTSTNEPTAVAGSNPMQGLETVDQHTISADREEANGNTTNETKQPLDGSDPVILPSQSQSGITPPNLELVTPQIENTKVEMVPLPLVLVRQSDGVGFGVGRNVVAERVDSKNGGQDKPRWGESPSTRHDHPFHK